ncbi:unnamed protein product [Blepharisma stoltei]|uniref:Uncharacterized protein n=1 Tax=Blepharisma stoltei TaxID=1481888 RepID=A0AAU9KBI2_9CILI|nr:unnamed protein product [Blepharisma stoltei]
MNFQTIYQQQPNEDTHHIRDLSFSLYCKDMFEAPIETPTTTSNIPHSPYKKFHLTPSPKQIKTPLLQTSKTPKIDQNLSFSRPSRIKSAKSKSKSPKIKWRSHSPTNEFTYTPKGSKSKIINYNKASIIIIPALVAVKDEKPYVKSMKTLYTRAKGKMPKPPSSPLKFNEKVPPQRKFRLIRSLQSPSNSISFKNVHIN